MIDRPAVSLHLFAHQDDELGILPMLRRELRENVRPVCLFLTSGAMPGRGGPAELALVRNAESLAVLSAAGCRSEDVHFLGHACAIDDGTLYLNLPAAFEALYAAVADLTAAAPQRIYCPAWEGGHHDHDAAHLLALALGARLGTPERVLQFPLYHGRGLPGPLFMPHSAIPENGVGVGIPLSRAEAVANWLQARHYRSQWRTWAGLLLPALLKAALSPALSLQPATAARARQRPHAGKLFYERRFGVPHERFRTITRPFIDAYLP